jgi:GT2 family glycosyltransferase
MEYKNLPPPRVDGYALSIIIPNYNGEELLTRFMPSVMRAVSNYQSPVEVIIIDDASKDESRGVMQQLATTYSRIKIFFNEKNKGFSGTCNVGIKEARYPVLFFLNNDVELEADYFSYFSSYFDNPDTFAVTTAGYYFNSRKPLDGIKQVFWQRGFLRVTQNIFNEQIEESQAVAPFLSFCVQGAYFFADAAKVNALQGFDEMLSPYIWEETDLSFRGSRRGWLVYYEPRCIGYHCVNTSINKVSTPFTKQVNSHRNQLLFIWKNISSPYYRLTHGFFLLIKIIFNKAWRRAFTEAYQRIPEVMEKRRIEAREAVLTDRQVIHSFRDYQKRFT